MTMRLGLTVLRVIVFAWTATGPCRARPHLGQSRAGGCRDHAGL